MSCPEMDFDACTIYLQELKSPELLCMWFWKSHKIYCKLLSEQPESVVKSNYPQLLVQRLGMIMLSVFPNAVNKLITLGWYFS